MKKELNKAYCVKTQSGSSLIMMALLIIVLGVFIVSGLELLKVYQGSKGNAGTLKNTENIQAGIDNFVLMNRRYPCPMPIDIPVTDPKFGLEVFDAVTGKCDMSVAGITNAAGRDPDGAGPLAPLNVLLGGIPVRSLNISDSLIVDGYNKRYVYAITEALASTSTNVNDDQGGIYISDKNGNSVSQADGHVVYALVSSNEDSRGAYNRYGALLEPREIGTLSDENYDGDAVFVTSQEFIYRGASSDFTANLAFKVNPVAHNWSIANWGGCTGVCFAGEQTRPINCLDMRGEIVPDGNCSHTQKPEDVRVCALPPCRWNIGGWSACRR